MRVLVCGSRNWKDGERILNIIKTFPKGTVIIEGGARGADTIAKLSAIKCKFEYEEYPAQWDKFGKSAGPIRNKQMLVEGKPELVLAFRMPNARGTQNMIDQATEAGVPVEVYEDGGIDVSVEQNDESVL